MTDAEEGEKQQERLERRLDQASGCALVGCLGGLLPVLGLILLPFSLLMTNLT